MPTKGWDEPRWGKYFPNDYPGDELPALRWGRGGIFVFIRALSRLHRFVVVSVARWHLVSTIKEILGEPQFRVIHVRGKNHPARSQFPGKVPLYKVLPIRGGEPPNEMFQID